jgi:hypothetical protein
MAFLLPDVASLVDDYNLAPVYGALQVERYAAPTVNSRGETTLPAPTIIRISPWTAHTASGRNLLQVPAADRNSEITEFYVKNIRLHVADGDRPPDVIRYADRRWRVITVNRYAPQGGVWFCMAALVDQQEPS